MLFSTNRTMSQKGFTLIEMLVVAPVIILMIGVIIGTISSVTGKSLRMNEKNAMTLDVQNALTAIESDMRRSQEILGTTGAVPSPQGVDNISTAFTTNFGASPTYYTSGPIILEAVATTLSPLNPNRNPVYLNTPNSSCSANTIESNNPYTIKYVYFLENGNLWRRTIMNNGTACTSTVPWQEASCKPGYTNTTVCKTDDELLLENVTSLQAQYYTDSNTTSPQNNTNNIKSINVSITSSKTVAGEAISYTASLRTNRADARVTPVADATPKTFNFTGSAQTYTVPAGINSIQIECWGAQGGNGNPYSTTYASSGGKGGYSKGNLAVTPGTILNIYVGGQGTTLASSPSSSTVQAPGGWNGGGTGTRYGMSGGGGASDVRQAGNSLNDRIIVAGGGGGGGNANSPPELSNGGGGGGLQAETVDAATQNGGRSPGSPASQNSGTLGVGDDTTQNLSGGGGGGYRGGGVGGNGAGGGGGSGYIGGVASGTMTVGINSGNGQIIITPL
jgi:type II secretory pathway pseudopilin PulG